MAILNKLFIFFLGSCIGSFLNVCIYRMPRKMSIVSPRSQCPNCKKFIAWYDNIPVLSFALLRRKCRRCGSKISFRYLFVEILAGLLVLFLFSNYGVSIDFVVYTVLFCSLTVVTFIDIDYQEIPDSISITGIFAGLLVSALYPHLQGANTNLAAFLSSMTGALAGGASIYLVGMIGKAVFRKEAMGGGDVKLLAMIGAFLGWRMAVITFFTAPFLGSVVGIALKIKTGQSLIPYGPFLSLASFIALFWGNDILMWLNF